MTTCVTLSLDAGRIRALCHEKCHREDRLNHRNRDPYRGRRKLKRKEVPRRWDCYEDDKQSR
jgi:hypothetical protein